MIEFEAVEVTAKISQLILLTICANMLSGVVDILDSKAVEEGKKVIASIALGVILFGVTARLGFNTLGVQGFVLYLPILVGFTVKSNSQTKQ